ncbi:MAG: PKD domain-containing protein [Candidatus Saccharimonadales bacterium]
MTSIDNRSLICSLQRTIIAIFYIGLIIIPVSVYANSYEVNAAVPYAASTQAAVIDTGLDGTTVHAALLTITGSCQLMNPVGAVSITDNGSAVGSTTCNGNFSLQIVLSQGQNRLVARTVNPSNIYGPDSSAVVVTLVLPVNIVTPTLPLPVANTNHDNQTPAQLVTATNIGRASALTATPTESFSVMDSHTHSATIQILIGGGTKPYSINLNWGDGTVESHGIAEPGTYNFNHTYQQAGSYIVKVELNDAQGAASVFNYAVLNGYKSPVNAVKIAAPNVISRSDSQYSVDAIIIFTVIGIFVALSSYLFGVRHAKALAKRYYQQLSINRARRKRLRLARAKRASSKK